MRPMGKTRATTHAAVGLAAVVMLAACSGADTSSAPTGGTAIDSTGPVTASSQVDRTDGPIAGGPLMMTATAEGDPVDVPAVLDGDTVLTMTVDNVEFRIVIPAGGVTQDITFRVSAAHTPLGDPAMLVEPAGWGLRKPAVVAANGTADALLAWGPAGTARRLPDRADTQSTTTVVTIGGVAVAHDEAQATAAEMPSGTATDAWTRSEEEDEEESPDGTVDGPSSDTLARNIAAEMACAGDDRTEAATALEAVRAGVAFDMRPDVPPDCFEVTAKISASTADDVGFDEFMSGSGRLDPITNGHRGRVELTVQSVHPAPPPTECSLTLLPNKDVFDVTSKWIGSGQAELTLKQIEMGKWDLYCPFSGHTEVPIFTASLLDGLGQGPEGLTVTTPVTEGSFHIFSLLEAFQASGSVDANGVLTDYSLGGAVRMTFTVEVLYTLAA